MTVLRVENLTVRYGALTALRDVSWEVAAGEVLGIIGPNGAGKSSCFAAVTNSVHHTGDVYLEGEQVSDIPTHKIASKGLRRTFQQNNFFNDLTVLENAVCAALHETTPRLIETVFKPHTIGSRHKQAREQASELLTTFGIGSEYHEMLPGNMPYGIQRLLSVVVAYGLDAKALLLDEPGAGTGSGELSDLAALIRQIAGTGCAIVIIEHHMDLIMNIADQIVVIDQGSVIAHGTPSEIRGDARVLEAYLGQTV